MEFVKALLAGRLRGRYESPWLYLRGVYISFRGQSTKQNTRSYLHSLDISLLDILQLWTYITSRYITSVGNANNAILLPPLHTANHEIDEGSVAERDAGKLRLELIFFIRVRQVPCHAMPNNRFNLTDLREDYIWEWRGPRFQQHFYHEEKYYETSRIYAWEKLYFICKIKNWNI